MDEQRDVTAFLGISRALESGRPISVRLPEVENPTLFTDADGYSIRVPPGATELEIVYDNNAAGVNVDLFVLKDFFPFVTPQGVVVDHFSTGPTGTRPSRSVIRRTRRYAQESTSSPSAS